MPLIAYVLAHLINRLQCPLHPDVWLAQANDLALQVSSRRRGAERTSNILSDDEERLVEPCDLLQDGNDVLDGLNLLVCHQYTRIVELHQLLFLLPGAASQSMKVQKHSGFITGSILDQPSADSPKAFMSRVSALCACMRA